MPEKITEYHIIPECRLIIEYYSGNILMEDIINLKKRLSLEKTYDPNINILHDFRDSNLLIEKYEIFEYIEFVKKHLKTLGKRQSAFLTDKPNEVVLTILFGEYNTDLPINSKIFSTIEHAIKWLGLQTLSIETINSVIEKLKTQHNKH